MSSRCCKQLYHRMCLASMVRGRGARGAGRNGGYRNRQVPWHRNANPRTQTREIQVTMDVAMQYASALRVPEAELVGAFLQSLTPDPTGMILDIAMHRSALIPPVMEISKLEYNGGVVISFAEIQKHPCLRGLKWLAVMSHNDEPVFQIKPGTANEITCTHFGLFLQRV
eukprot:symbB.v1.2.036183.t1/scaffold4831.1/size56663/1